MKNRIAVFGGNQFESIVYNNNSYELRSENFIKMLYAMYDVYNYSYKGLTISKSKKILKNIVEETSFEMCIISVSDNENSPLDEFIYNFNIMLDLLKEKNIKVVIVANENAGYVYNHQMKKLANIYDCQYVSNITFEDSKVVKGELLFA